MSASLRYMLCFNCSDYDLIILYTVLKKYFLSRAMSYASVKPSELRSPPSVPALSAADASFLSLTKSLISTSPSPFISPVSPVSHKIQPILFSVMNLRAAESLEQHITKVSPMLGRAYSSISVRLSGSRRS